MTEVTIPARFNGPPNSGNGGYTSGVLAAAAHPDGTRAVVTLRLPPPLDVPLVLRAEADHIGAFHGDALIATITAGDGDLPLAGMVDPEVAAACEKEFAGDAEHPFPTCFSCGPARPDGLRLRPGPVPGVPATVACTWTPAPGLTSPEIIWAALDCPGAGWSPDLPDEARVLGRMTTQVFALPEPGERHVIVGHAGPQDGRKLPATTTLYTESGTPLATASALWITLPPK